MYNTYIYNAVPTYICTYITEAICWIMYVARSGDGGAGRSDNSASTDMDVLYEVLKLHTCSRCR